MRKRLARQAAVLRLRTLSSGECQRRSAALAHRLMQWEPFHAARAVLLFAPIARSKIPEVDLTPLATLAITRGGPHLYVPRVDWNAGRLIPTRVLNWAADLIPGPRGVCEPAPSADTIDPAQLDLILVPGLAFNHAGHRLGRGGGFYDRFLAHESRRAPLVAVCFDRQLADAPIPTEPHDIAMHVIITESRTFIAGENT